MRNERKVLRCNSDLVDTIFELLFEVFWVAPLDVRRHNAELVDFDRTARRLAVVLGDTDLRTASQEKAGLLMQLIQTLVRGVQQIEASRLFPPVQCQKASQMLDRIAGQVRVGCGVRQ